MTITSTHPCVYVPSYVDTSFTHTQACGSVNRIWMMISVVTFPVHHAIVYQTILTVYRCNKWINVRTPKCTSSLVFYRKAPIKPKTQSFRWYQPISTNIALNRYCQSISMRGWTDNYLISHWYIFQIQPTIIVSIHSHTSPKREIQTFE